MAEKQPGVASLDEAKRWLRRHLAGLRQALSPRERRSLSRRVVASLTRSKEYARARTIALFLGFGSEVETEALVRHAWSRGKNVLIPITTLGFDRPFFALFRKGDPLIKTSYGPWELVEQRRPFDMKKIDLVVVPGLGFDDDGYRLGYGGGVYDRLLEKTPRARHVGLFFSFQRVHAIPRGKHDRPMTAIVTEKGLCTASRA
jgi:5-formyltetrahydrofolate cyclo-ligase